MILQPASFVICADKPSLEPVRSGHFVCGFVNPGGDTLYGDANIHIRSVSGLSQAITAGSWGALNYQLPFPQALSVANVVIQYIFLTDKNMSKKVLQWWQQWKELVYDFDNDLPALYNICTGSGTVDILNSDGDALSSFQLAGIWPTNIPIGTLDRESSEPVKFSVELAVTQLKPIDPS